MQKPYTQASKEENPSAPLLDHPPPYSEVAPARPTMKPPKKIKEPPPPYSEDNQTPSPTATATVSVNILPYPEFPKYPGEGQGGQGQGSSVYGATVVNVPAVDLISVGGCPVCSNGILQDEYPCCALFLAIFFFPIGLLCCLAMKSRRCNNCGTYF